MHVIRKSVIIVVLGMNLGAVTFAASQDKMPAPGSPEAAKMEAAQKLMMPGENHHRLNPLTGKWNAKVSMWMTPGAPPQVSGGTSENAWVLNSHFMQTTYHGSFNNQPFDGIGYIGYDNVRGEYQSIWLDNFGTGMMVGQGPAGTSATTVAYSGTFGCPMTGEKDRWYRSEMKILGPDKNVFSSYSKGPDGKEFKGMEIVYTRAGK